MSPDQVIDLLTLATRFDQRTVGDEDVRAWGLIANEEDWHPMAAARALVEHVKVDATPVRPAHITAILASVRREIRSRFTEDVCPPRELADDPRAEIAWRRRRVVEFVDLAFEAWARREPIPNPPQRRELGETMRPELTAAVDRFETRRAVPVGRERRPTTHSPEHDEHRAVALAALDERRPALDRLRTPAVTTPESRP
jgi:hypothetical protein